MATFTEILPTDPMPDGFAFLVELSFTHVPGADLPTAQDVNLVLDSIGAEILCDSIAQTGTDTLGNLATAGLAVFAELNCHIHATGDLPHGGQVLAWLIQAFSQLAEIFSFHTPNISIGRQGAAASGPAGGVIGTAAGAAADAVPSLPAAPFIAASSIAVAVIVIVLFVAWNEVRHAG